MKQFKSNDEQKSPRNAVNMPMGRSTAARMASSIVNEKEKKNDNSIDAFALIVIYQANFHVSEKRQDALDVSL